MNLWPATLFFVLPLLGQPALPKFTSAADLERFLLAPDEDGVRTAMELVFPLQHAGRLVTAAQQYGPANARRAAEIVTSPAMRESYLDLARYLDQFGPCQKKLAGEHQGWWSSYGEPPADSICAELVKLMFGAALSNQVEYCRQLAAGEVTPKTPVPEGRHPPYRLDEPPVSTVWIKPDVLYALADAALTLKLQSRLRQHAGSGSFQRACEELAERLEQETPNREGIALSLAHLLLRHYQALHQGHLELKTNPR